jgi:ABC-type transport system involved in multi-copper enzyme maturation permease subunit
MTPERLAQAIARMGQEFLFSFLAVEAVIVMLLTPLLVASAWEEERRQRTLDLLLTTHLTPGQIIIGKALPRVLLLGGLALGGLAFPAIAQLQGGIDAQLVLASMLILLSGLLSQAAITLWHAACGSSLLTVLMLNYLLLLAWIMLGLVRLPPWLPWLDEALIWTNAPRMLRFLSEKFSSTGFLDQWPWKLALAHALIHGTLAGLLLWRAGRRLRQGLERSGTTPTGATGGRGGFWTRTRPAFNEKRPLLWKERSTTQLAARLAWLILGGILLITLACFEYSISNLGWYNYHERSRDMFVILSLSMLLVPMILAALKAAWSVRREAERATWDTLMVTPIQVHDLIRAKWQASLLSVGPPIIILSGALGIYLLYLGRLIRNDPGDILGTLSSLFALLLLNLGAATMLATSVGLLMSVGCRTGMRATIATFIALTTLAGLPVLCGQLNLFASHRVMYWVILKLAAVVEIIAWLGAPLILIFIAGFLSIRVRRGLDLVFRAVAIPFVTALILQLPILLLLASIAAFDDGIRLGGSLPLLSPIGFVIALASQTVGPFFLFALVINGSLAYAVYRGASWLAVRTCGRIDHAPHRRRRLPLPRVPRSVAARRR